jgi:glycosyltransferase involved in cell wall biosynthesis
VIPLRILHCLSGEPGPAREAARVLIGALNGRGHESAIAAASLEGFTQLDGVECFAFGGGMISSLFGARSGFAQRIALWIPDVIHVHDLESLPLALDLARRLALSVVISVHGGESGPAERLLRDPRVAWVLIPSEVLRARYLCDIGLDRDRVAILPPGIDVAAAAACPYRTADGTMVIGCLARLEDPDGIDRFCAAVAAVAKEQTLRVLFRVDATDDAEEAETAFQRRGLGTLVEVAPPMPVGEFMSRIDIVVDPEAADHHPGPVLEAMACARPVVAIAAGSMPELTRDGVTALLAEKGKQNALADALRQLCDRERRRMLGEAGRALAVERYDVAIIAEAAVEFYRGALGATTNANAKAESSTTYRRLSEARAR